MAGGNGIMSDGKLSYMQIPALDPEASGAFYRDVFGWQLSGTPEHRSFSDKSGELIGAFITDRAISSEPGILPYVYVDSIDAAMVRITGRGGEIVREPYPEGDLWVATFLDPAWNQIGVRQMGQRGVS
jgi:predicted enzyme related to lactoylglutathione lyase